MVNFFPGLMSPMFLPDFSIRQASLVRRYIWTWADSALSRSWRRVLAFLRNTTFTAFDPMWVASTIIFRVEVCMTVFALRSSGLFPRKFNFHFCCCCYHLSAIVILARNSGRFTLLKRCMILVTRSTCWPSFIKLNIFVDTRIIETIRASFLNFIYFIYFKGVAIVTSIAFFAILAFVTNEWQILDFSNNNFNYWKKSNMLQVYKVKKTIPTIINYFENHIQCLGNDSISTYLFFKYNKIIKLI